MRYYTWIMLFFLLTSCTHHQAVKSNQRGMDYITREQPRKALEEFNNAITLDPNFLSAYYNRAIIQANLKQNKEALEDINYVIANAHDYAMAYYNRAIIHENLGQPTLAIQDYSRAINLQPDLLEAYHYRGIVRYGMKDLTGLLRIIIKPYLSV